MVTQDATLPQRDEDIGRLTAALGDATRRRVFFALRSAAEPQTKDDIARAVGIERRLAGFHLDKLVEYGFAGADMERPREAAGPGRPAKRYVVAHSSVLVAKPERHYDLLASLLLRASRGEDAGSQGALERVGYEYGLQLGLAQIASGSEKPSAESLTEALGAVARMMTDMGFSADTGQKAAATGPEGHEAVALRAHACPFEELAFDDPARICGLDRALWRGMIAAFAPDARVTIDRTRAEGDELCLVVVEDEDPR